MKDTNIGYYFLVMASVVIVLAGVKSASAIIIPFLLSLFLAIILSPMYNFFRKKSLPDWLALTLVITLFVILLALVAKLIGSSAHEFRSNVDLYVEKLTVYYLYVKDFFAKIGIEIPFDEISNMINTKQIMNFSTGILQSVSSLFTNGFIILLTVAFMLLESKNFTKKIEFASEQSGVINHIDSISSQIKEYMVLKAIISLFTGLIVWIALLLIGTDYPFLWATLAFMLNFIPNIGSIIAAVPAVLLTLVQLGVFNSLIVALIYIVVNVVMGSIVEPKIMGKGLGLSTLVVFLSLLFWGWLLGMVGMLLSIPLTIMVKIVLDANENTRWIAVLLGSGENIPVTNENKRAN